MTELSRPPRLSLVVVVYDMRREAPRTLYSLSAAYQRDIEPGQYEVIVVDNGSPEPLGSAAVEGLGGNFRYLLLEDPPSSPAYALNFGALQAAGELLGLMIDGARIVSPGMLHLALVALRSFERAVVTSLAFHLGPKTQMESVLEGYDQAVEDRLLASVDWREDGYRLFDIASLAGSSADGWFLPVAESNCVFLSRDLFDELGGFEERFVHPGGGLVNLDFHARACALEDSRLVMLLGEGTFHQFHGGAMANRPRHEHRERWRAYQEEYESIRGAAFAPPTRRPLLLGDVSGPAVRWVRESCDLFEASMLSLEERE